MYVFMFTLSTQYMIVTQSVALWAYNLRNGVNKHQSRYLQLLFRWQDINMWSCRFVRINV